MLDLSAQQDMGDWAFWVVWVSVGSVAVTTVAAILVWRTLVHTAEIARDTNTTAIAAAAGARHSEIAANATVRAAEAAVAANELQSKVFITSSRARVSVKVKIASDLCWDKERREGRMKFLFTLKNKGRTDAKNCCISAKLDVMFFTHPRKIYERVRGTPHETWSGSFLKSDGEPILERHSLSITNDEIKEWCEFMDRRTGRSFVDPWER